MEDLCFRLATDLDGSFPEVVKRFQDEVFSGLRSLAGADAEDLAQETFIRAYRALKEYEADRIRELRLRGWIWTIALNLGRNPARDRARHPTRSRGISGAVRARPTSSTSPDSSI